MQADPAAFQYAGHETGKTAARFAWRSGPGGCRTIRPGRAGVSLMLKFRPPAGCVGGLEVRVHYEMYDGIPLTCKWGRSAMAARRPCVERAGKRDSAALSRIDGGREGGDPFRNTAGLQVERITPFGRRDGLGLRQPGGALETRSAVWDAGELELQTPCMLSARRPWGRRWSSGRANRSSRTGRLSWFTTDGARAAGLRCGGCIVPSRRG